MLRFFFLVPQSWCYLNFGRFVSLSNQILLQKSAYEFVIKTWHELKNMRKFMPIGGVVCGYSTTVPKKRNKMQLFYACSKYCLICFFGVSIQISNGWSWGWWWQIYRSRYIIKSLINLWINEFLSISLSLVSFNSSSKFTLDYLIDLSIFFSEIFLVDCFGCWKVN